MRHTCRCLRALTLSMLAAAPLAGWALDSTVETGLEVIGSVVPLPTQQQSVVTLPLPVSQIAVADASPGVFGYMASADIGLLELKVFASLTNSSNSDIGNGERPLIRVRSEVRDVLTFNSNLTDPYTLTFELDVDGAITGSGFAVANAFIDFGLLGAVNGNDSGAYFSGPITDTLTVSRQVSGATVAMDFTASLNFVVTTVAAGNTVTGALDNTATMRLILPAGVSLASSASGTFGVPIAPIPEPATWALLLAGAAFLGWRAQRRGLRPTLQPLAA